MMLALFKNKKFEVKNGQIGFLYRRNIFIEKLNAGVYEYWDFKNELNLLVLPTVSRWVTVNNQEVLTKDGVALRFSYFVYYKIADYDLFLAKSDLSQPIEFIQYQADIIVQNLSQVHFRNKIVTLNSEELNEKRNEIIDFQEILQKELEGFGLEIQLMNIRDITFPKPIQDLFSKKLEAKIKTQTELENARTAVASARALKNAADLMKDDDNIKFMQMLDIVSKIAEKGKHTFVFGDLMEKIMKKN